MTTELTPFFARLAEAADQHADNLISYAELGAVRVEVQRDANAAGVGDELRRKLAGL